MLRLRALQDETGGFQTFIPLAFHPDNNALMKLPGPTGVEDLRTYAVARLVLDNIPHIKAYWIMLGVKTAQSALWFGADDLDGTVQEEKIYHMAGAETPQVMPRRDCAHHPERRPHARRARHALQRRRRGRGARRPTSPSAATSAAASRSCRERAARSLKIRLPPSRSSTRGPSPTGSSGALGEDRFELSFELPSRCAQLLAAGEVDVGLIPVAAYAESPTSCAPSPASPSPASAPCAPCCS